MACRVSRVTCSVAWCGVVWRGVIRRGAAWHRVASRRTVARIPRTAPLSSNYRSNGVSLGVDPTPASICRLALIQLPWRQLPRWYTCGRFIASTVIRVRRSPLFPPLCPSLYPASPVFSWFDASLLPRSIIRLCFASTRWSFRVPTCELLLERGAARGDSIEHEKFTSLL